jgi:hypothetical protein
MALVPHLLRNMGAMRTARLMRLGRRDMDIDVMSPPMEWATKYNGMLGLGNAVAK